MMSGDMGAGSIGMLSAWLADSSVAAADMESDIVARDLLERPTARIREGIAWNLRAGMSGLAAGGMVRSQLEAIASGRTTVSWCVGAASLRRQ